MKRVESIIKPYKLEEVTAALRQFGVEEINVSEVRGFGRQKGQTQSFRGDEYTVEFLPKVKLDFVVAAADVGGAIAVIVRAAQTGRIGDGKIFVSDVAEVITVL